MAKKRILLAGCGGMSRAWLEAVKGVDGVEVVGLVDLDQAAAEKRAREFALKEAWVSDNLEAALDRLGPEAVFDVTVPKAHKAVTLTALQHGCHVLGEKPMAESMDDAREMVEAARRADRIYAVIQNRRYNPSIRSIAKALREGIIGTVHTVNADFYLAPHFGGFREAMEHVLLLDMAIHSFDQARCITGADPVDVYCREFNPAGSWFRHGASAMAIFGMTQDIVFNYRGSWCAEGLPTTWDCHWRIVGSEGTLLWDGAEDIRVAVAGDVNKGIHRSQVEKTVEQIPWDDHMNGHQGLIRDFIACIASGTLPLTHCGDNIKSLAMVHGAIASAETGRTVSLAD